jgi:hypothetical protein
MAQVPYKAAPRVEPTAAPPPDYFHLDVNPNQFGGLIAKGLQQLGAGVESAAETWTEMQKDAAVNDALKESTAAMEEFKKLSGAEAVAAEPAYRARIDQIIQEHGANLPGKWQTQYNTAIRPYQFRTLNGEMQTHAIQQRNESAKATNTTTQELAGNIAATNYNDPVAVDNAIQMATNAAVKQVELQGNAGIPSVRQEAIDNARAYVLSRVGEAKYVHFAPDGKDFVDQHQKELGAHYAPLADKFRARAETVDAENSADVTKQIYSTNDPIARRSILDANKSRLTEKAWKDLDAAVTAGEVKPAAPGTTQAQPVPGSPIQPGESPTDYANRRIREEGAKNAPAAPQKPLQGGPGITVTPEITPARMTQAFTAKGRGELIEEAIHTYAPGTMIKAPGYDPWPVPKAGTTFEIEGIKHTVPAAPAPAPAAAPAPAVPGAPNFTPIPPGALGTKPQAAAQPAPATAQTALQAVNSAADPHQGAYTYFQSSGWTPAQAAGIVGGLRGETENLNATESHDSGRGIGIAGWNGDRRAELQRFAAANGLDMNARATQLQFVNHELQTNEKAAGDKIRAATTPEQAAQAMLEYLRPSGYDRPGAHPERARYAREFFDKYGAGGTTAIAMQFSGENREPHDHDIAAYRTKLEGGNRTAAEEQGEQARVLASPARVVELQGQGGHVRDLPIKEELRNQLDVAAKATETKAVVISGGQPSSGRNRTGSHRHDNGGAADIELRDAKTGRLLDMNNKEDAARMAMFVTASVAAGATGVGAGVRYMGPHMIHVGGGRAATWGDADWISHAWLAGQNQQASQ